VLNHQGPTAWSCRLAGVIAYLGSRTARAVPLCERVLLSACSRVAAKTKELMATWGSCQLVTNVPGIGVTRPVIWLSRRVMLVVRGTRGQIVTVAGRWQVR
jgi:hypothetical protein